MAPMPELTRRRSLDAPDECWHVYYGDVRVGTIAIRTGIPPHEDPWGWACGFYPGSHPGECTDGADSMMHGDCFWLSGRKQILRLGAHSGTGPAGNMRCGKPAT